MAPRKLFGSLNLEGNVGRGENTNGMVTQTSNGTFVNGTGADGQNAWDAGVWPPGADGRWNKIAGESNGLMPELGVKRPQTSRLRR
jgi:hypothetical protein